MAFYCDICEKFHAPNAQVSRIELTATESLNFKSLLKRENVLKVICSRAKNIMQKRFHYFNDLKNSTMNNNNKQKKVRTITVRMLISAFSNTI